MGSSLRPVPTDRPLNLPELRPRGARLRRFLLTPQEEQELADAARAREATAAATMLSQPGPQGVVASELSRTLSPLAEAFQASLAPQDRAEGRPSPEAMRVTAAKLAAAESRLPANDPRAIEARRMAHNLYTGAHLAEQVYTGDVAEAFSNYIPTRRPALRELTRAPSMQARELLQELGRPGAQPVTTRPTTMLRSMTPMIGDVAVAAGLAAATGGAAGAAAESGMLGEGATQLARTFASQPLATRLGLRALQWAPGQAAADVAGMTAQGMTPGESLRQSLLLSATLGPATEAVHEVAGAGLRGAGRIIRGAERAPDVVERAIERGHFEPRPVEAQRNWERLVQTEQAMRVAGEAEAVPPEVRALAVPGSPENVAAREAMRAAEAAAPAGPVELPSMLQPTGEPIPPPTRAPAGPTARGLRELTAPAQAAEQFPQLVSAITEPVARAGRRIARATITPVTKRAAAVAAAGTLASQVEGEEPASPVAQAALLGAFAVTPEGRLLRGGRLIRANDPSLGLAELEQAREVARAAHLPSTPGLGEHPLLTDLDIRIGGEIESQRFEARQRSGPMRALQLAADGSGAVQDAQLNPIRVHQLADNELDRVGNLLAVREGTRGLSPGEEQLSRALREEGQHRAGIDADEAAYDERYGTAEDFAHGHVEERTSEQIAKLWDDPYASEDTLHRSLVTAIGNVVEGHGLAAGPPERAAFEGFERRYPELVAEAQRTGAAELPEAKTGEIARRIGLRHLIVMGEDGSPAHILLVPPEAPTGSVHISSMAHPKGAGGVGNKAVINVARWIKREYPESAPPEWTHIGGRGARGKAGMGASPAMQRRWPGLAPLATFAALWGMDLSKSDDELSDGLNQAGAGLPISTIAMAAAAGLPEARLAPVLKATGLALGGTALANMARDEDWRATGRGAQYLGLASALWASHAPQRAWGAMGDMLVERARQTPHGTGFVRRLIEGTNPEAMLEPQVRAYIRQYEDRLGEITARGEHLGAVARNQPAELDRWISDLVENENFEGLGGLTEAEMQQRLGPDWRARVRAAMQTADAIREESGAQTEAKFRAGMLSPEAVEKYRVEGAPTQSSHLRRVYAEIEGERANPAWAGRPGTGQPTTMRVPAETRARSLDVPVDAAQRELTTAETQLADLQSRRADEPQPTPAELEAAQKRVTDAQAAHAQAVTERDVIRQQMGEIREASYRVPEQAREAGRQIAGAELFHNLSQLDDFMSSERKLLHPDWLAAQRERIAAREAEAWTTDLEAEANATQVRDHITQSLDQTREKLASLDAQIAQDTAAGKPVGERARARRRDLAQQMRRAEESLPYWEQMAAQATDKPARELARGRIATADEELGRLRDRFAVEGAKPEAGQHWVSLPKSGFGPMSGAVVTQDLQHSLQGIIKPDRTVLADFLRWWKRQKTVYSPGTHVGNIMSNVVMAHMAGLPIHELLPWMRKAARAMDEVRAAKPERLSGGGAMVQRLRGMGVLGSLTEAEGTRIAGPGRVGRLAGVMEGATPRVRQLLAEANIEEPQSWLQRVAPTAARGAEAATQLYQGEDDLFRVAMAMWRQSQGDAPEAAADFARRNLIDYRTRSPFLRNVARSGIAPFALYPAKAIPTFAQHVLEHPERWVTLMAPFAGLNEWAKANVPTGETIQPEDLPPEQRRPSWAGYLMPGMTQLGAVGRETPLGAERVGINPSRWFPISSLVDRPPPEEYRNVLPSWWPRLLTPSGPTFEMPMTLATGRDQFTGRPIVPPGASVEERLSRTGTRLARDLFSPLVGVGERAWESAVSEGRPVGATAGQAVGQMLGIRPNIVQPGRYAGRTATVLREDADARMLDAQREISAAAPEEREEVQARVVKQVEEDLNRLVDQAVSNMGITDEDAAEDLRAELQDQMARRVEDLQDFDPDEAPAETPTREAFTDLIQRLRAGRVRR